MNDAGRLVDDESWVIYTWKVGENGEESVGEIERHPPGKIVFDKGKPDKGLGQTLLTISGDALSLLVLEDLVLAGPSALEPEPVGPIETLTEQLNNSPIP